uniref:Uncharacterized protein n=2 Tax=Davidia involucrata TaxID=16924 RepID=A0A5B7B379_DAVIN
MGRKIPIGENPSIHPVLSLSLFVACIAATIAIISSLCGALWRKKSTSQHKTRENSDVASPPPNEATPPPTTVTAVGLEDTKDRTSPQNEEPPLPPPPGMLRGHYRSHSTASRRRLSFSLSMRLPGGGLVSRQQSRRELEQHDKKRDKKLNHEDSIWKKTIILGEKCRVPDEDEDAILYDEKGNRISTYHPKVPTSLPVSRQTSFIDLDAIPSLEGQEIKEVKKP